MSMFLSLEVLIKDIRLRVSSLSLASLVNYLLLASKRFTPAIAFYLYFVLHKFTYFFQKVPSSLY